MVQRCSNGVAFLVLEPEPSIRTGIRVDIYDGDDPATLLAVLPDTWGREWTDPIRGPGSGRFTVALDNPALVANPGLLAYGNIARFSLDEVYRFAIVIEHKDQTQVKVGGDVHRTLTVSGRGVLAKLEETELYPAGGLGGDPERAFTNATAGEVLGLVVDEGQARGGLVGIQKDFTDTEDANNAPYTTTVTFTERPGTSGLRLVEKIQELAADVYMTPAGQLKVVNERGIDRTLQTADVGPVILQAADNVEELTRSEDGAIRNVLLIETPGGFVERVQSGSISAHGRREAFLSLGNMTDTSAIDKAADAVFQRSAEPAAEIGVQVVDRDGARPYVDWGPGYWVLAPNESDELERLRVRALTVSEDDEGNPVFVPELATITEELEARLTRWLSAMAKGTVGGTAGTIAEPVKAPVEVVEAVDAGIGTHLSTQPHHDELADLADVDLTGIADDDVLRYDLATGDFLPETLNLDALDDVDVTTTPPTDQQALVYDLASGLWVPGDVAAGGGGGSAASGATVHRTTNQSIPSAAVTAISWSTEDFDRGDLWNAGSPTRFTAPASGLYRVSAVILWAAHATGQRQVRIHVNGSEVRTLAIPAPPDAESLGMSTSELLDLTAGDYVEVFAYQDSGGALNLIANAGKTLAASIEHIQGGGGGGSVEKHRDAAAVVSAFGAAFETPGDFESWTPSSGGAWASAVSYGAANLWETSPQSGSRYGTIRRNSITMSVGDTAIAALRFIGHGSNSGIAWVVSEGGKEVGLEFEMDHQLPFWSWNNPTFTTYNTWTIQPVSDVLWLGIKYEAANSWRPYWSVDGQNWAPLRAAQAFTMGAPTAMYAQLRLEDSGSPGMGALLFADIVSTI